MKTVRVNKKPTNLTLKVNNPSKRLLIFMKELKDRKNSLKSTSN